MKLRRSMNRCAGLGLLALTLVFVNGCWLFVAGAGAGAGAVWYYGALRSTEEAGHKAVFDASEKAMEDLGMSVEKKSEGATTSKLEGKAADGKIVRISVDRVSENTSELTIRMGLADEAGARRIYEQIKANLPGVAGSLAE